MELTEFFQEVLPEIMERTKDVDDIESCLTVIQIDVGDDRANVAVGCRGGLSLFNMLTAIRGVLEHGYPIIYSATRQINHPLHDRPDYEIETIIKADLLLAVTKCIGKLKLPEQTSDDEVVQ